MFISVSLCLNFVCLYVYILVTKAKSESLHFHNTDFKTNLYIIMLILCDITQKETCLRIVYIQTFFCYDQSTVGLKLNFDVFLSTMCYMKFVKSWYVFCQSYIIPSAINMGHELYIYFIKQKLNKTTDKRLLHIFVSSTYCVVFLFCSSSSCVPSLDCTMMIYPFGTL